jgi:hypothetical protein
MQPAIAQDERRESLAGEAAARSARKGEVPPGYNLRYGPVAFSVHASMRTELYDNAFYSELNRRMDIVLRPECKLNALWPISELNSLSLSLGIGYQRYLNNTVLNTDRPLISPDSDLALTVFAGDFRIKLHESFSYQESPYLGSYSYQSPEFFNLNDIGKFSRFENTAGTTVDWDLHDLILSFSYDHENFWMDEARFRYLDRASELLVTSATFLVAPAIKPGLEASAKWHDLQTETRLHDQWRASVGPFLDLRLTLYLNLHLGAGFDTSQIRGSAAKEESTWYAYGKFIHRVNQYLSHSLAAGHENQLGWNADYIQTDYVRHGLTWTVNRYLDLGTYWAANFAKETGRIFLERYQYYQAGMTWTYIFDKHWSASLQYSFLAKESNLIRRDYYQNRFAVGLAFRF